ncbi:DUF4124 domain-containing protein, partial [Leclercia adecarboxylata]|uniref:DUF4124 domain-containing protein n=1 Tax=Leclercia adecarboxylata TaxID=83655 RepID=UPI0036F25F72
MSKRRRWFSRLNVDAVIEGLVRNMRALLLTAVLVPMLASAQIYRWTDAEGRVHFGQRPPAGAEQVNVRP